MGTCNIYVYITKTSYVYPFPREIIDPSTHRPNTAAADRKVPDSEPKVEELKFPAMAWAYGLASARYMDSMKTSKGSRDSIFCKKKTKEGWAGGKMKVIIHI